MTDDDATPTAALVVLGACDDDDSTEECPALHATTEVRTRRFVPTPAQLGLPAGADPVCALVLHRQHQPKHHHQQRHQQQPHPCRTAAAPLYTLHVRRGTVRLAGTVVRAGTRVPVPRGRAVLEVLRHAPPPDKSAKNARETPTDDEWADAEIVDVVRAPRDGSVAAAVALYTAPRAPEAGANYRFYRNALCARPDGVRVDALHRAWRGDYARLEAAHGYIQWLFPVFADAGVNPAACALGHGEARLMRRDLDVAVRIVRSYRLMLDFYGLVLVDETTGAVAYAPDAAHCRARLANVCAAPHNNLRITRILTSLGHLGFARYRRPLVRLLARAIADGLLPTCTRSYTDFWRPTLACGTPAHRRKTCEHVDEREPSVFFSVSPRPSTALDALDTATPASPSTS